MSATVLVAIAIALSQSQSQSSSPVQNTYAYSRATTPGIPPGGGVGALPERAPSTLHFVYVVLRRGTTPSTCGVWLNGTYHGARLQKVTSPVTIDVNPAVPTGQRETLVPRTASDVYQVSPTEPKPWTPETDAERQLTRDNEVVVFVQANGATWHGTVKTIRVLAPVPGQ